MRCPRPCDRSRTSTRRPRSRTPRLPAQEIGRRRLRPPALDDQRPRLARHHGVPGAGDGRDLALRQRLRRVAPDAHAPRGVPGPRPRRVHQGAGRRDHPERQPAGAAGRGERLEGHRARRAEPDPARDHALRGLQGQVRVPLPHPRARGPRDDAAVRDGPVRRRRGRSDRDVRRRRPEQPGRLRPVVRRRGVRRARGHGRGWLGDDRRRREGDRRDHVAGSDRRPRSRSRSRRRSTPMRRSRPPGSARARVGTA